MSACHPLRLLLLPFAAAGLLAATAAQAQSDDGTDAQPAPAAARVQAAPAAPPPPMASQQPVPLFKTVCVDGTARLSTKWAVRATYAGMPDAARALVGQPVMSVSNPVFQIGGGNEYLILPNADSAMPFAPACAVVWQAEAPAEAKKLAAVLNKDLAVTTETKDGWTMLKSVPTAPPSKPSE